MSRRRYARKILESPVFWAGALGAICSMVTGVVTALIQKLL
jgi:hypothetical protein